MRYESPLRYPGGKGRLAQYFKALFRTNDLLESEYVEVFAGGASVALALLFSEYAARIHINDLSRPIYAFWHSVLNEPDKLCSRISKARLDLREWRRQRAVLMACERAEPLELGFATFYVNRTSRSGIIGSRAGIIGGNHQTGPWRLDARYNAPALIERIERVARQRHRISLYNLDAELLLRNVVPRLGQRTLVYLDPPYFRKGQRLYTNFYEPGDHAAIARRARHLKQPWLISYDDVPEVRRLYRGCTRQSYTISYTAGNRYAGAEVLFFSANIVPPKISDPARFTEEAFRSWLKRCRTRAA